MEYRFFITEDKKKEWRKETFGDEYEKLLYSSKTGEIYIQKQKADGTKENLWKKEYIDITKQNIFKLPIGVSEIRLSADDDVANAKLIIYPQYKAV